MIAGDLTTLENVKGWLNISTANDDALLNRLISASSKFVQSWLNRQLSVIDQTVTRNGTGTSMLAFGDQPVLAVASVVIAGQAIPASVDGVSAGYVFDARMLYLIGYKFPMGMQNVKIAYTYGYRKSAEASIIPASATYTIFAASLALPWNADISVNYTGGAALVKVTSSPSVGQYTCLDVGGIWTYTFSAADAGRGIGITYSYTPPEIEQAVIELVSLRHRERNRIGENSKSIGGEVVSYSVKDMPDSVKTILNNYRRVVSVY